MGCVLGGLIKFNGGERTFNDSGCEPIADFVPYTEFSLKEPTDNRTRRTHWCPTVASYNGKDNASPGSKRKNWGYCLTIPATDFPTSSPTSSPTFAPTSAPTYTEYWGNETGTPTESP